MAAESGRVDEMHSAVRKMIAVYTDWVNDPRQPETPTLAFEKALRHAVDVVLNGDIPGRCQPLWTAVSRLQEEWNQYARGERDRRGRPLPRFWAAFTAVENSLRQSATVKAKRMEPVKALLDQKVSYEQIAFHIYGYRGKGPLVNEAGQPDVDLIHQEAEKPGSVVPEGWVHPIQAELTSDSIVQQSRQTDWVNDMETGREVKPQIIDPATIEQLLREGQFPDVIAKVKAVSLEDVHAEAKRLGIKVNVRPNFGGADLAEDDITAGDESAESSTETAATPADATTEPAYVPSPIGDTDPAELDDRIVTLAGQNKGASEIAAELGVPPQKVAAVLRKRRQKAAAAATA